MTKTSSPFLVTEQAALERSSLDYGSIEEAFPEAVAGVRPFGDKVLVQIRTPMTRTKTGFFLPEETRDTERWNTQVAKVIAIGPVAFKNRDTLQPWPEGDWVKLGMYVRVPLYGGDRWEVPVPGSKNNEHALFVIFRDVDLVGEVEGDPLAMVAYLK